jgi:hypothetical protein
MEGQLRHESAKWPAAKTRLRCAGPSQNAICSFGGASDVDNGGRLNLQPGKKEGYHNGYPTSMLWLNNETAEDTDSISGISWLKSKKQRPSLRVDQAAALPV